MKRGLIALAAALAVIVLLLAAAVAVVGAAPDRLKPLVVALVARGGHQSITLDGPISLSLLPHPELRAETVALSAGPGRIEAGRLVAHLALRPLLARQIVVTRLDLDHAVWHPASGEGAPDSVPDKSVPDKVASENDAPGGADGTSPPARKPRDWRISLLALRLTDAHVAVAGLAAPLAIIRLDLPALPGPSATAVTLDARYAGVPFSVSGMIARLPGDALSLGGLRVVARQGDLGLDGTLHLAPHPAFAGKLAIHRLDLDALRHALPRRVPPPSPAPAAAEGAAPAPTPPDWRERPLAFLAFLGAADLDLALTVETLIESGATYRDIAAHVVLHDRRLVVDPVHLVVPGGAVSGALSLDAAVTPPSATLHVLAPSLALGPLAGAFHWPADNTGALEVFADLSAAGATPRALAATLSGRLGIAAVNATLANRLLLQALGQVLRQARLPAIGLDLGGRTDLRCLALGVGIAAGVARLDPALAETSHLDLGAAGTLDLGAATMAVRLVPSLRIGGNALVVPLRLAGPLADPKLAPDPDQGDGALAASACEPALARARGGRAGPAPAPAKPEKGLSLHDILRGLVK